MRHSPRAMLRDTVADVLLYDQQQDEAAARRVADEVAGYLTVTDVGGPHFELLDVTMPWRSLCKDVAAGGVATPDDDFGGWVLLGALRWLYQMQPFAPKRVPDTEAFDMGDLDHVEAAMCLALVALDEEPVLATPYPAMDERTQAVLAAHALGTADAERTRTARQRLQQIGALVPHRGRLGLRDEVAFQMPDD